MGLPLVQQSGEYWMQLIVNYCSSIPLLIIALVECIAVSYVYGIDRWEINTRLLTLFTIYMYNWKKKTPEILVNYHLHEQTGRLTVWVNDRQNSGLINFVLESLTFVQIGSIYWKTVVALKKSNTNFCLEDSIRKNRTALWEIFRRKLLVNGIQPLNWKLEFRWNTHQWRTCSIWQWFHSFPPWAEPKWPRDRLKLAKLHENTEKVSNGKRELPFQKFHVLRKLLSGRHEKLCVALTFQPASPVFLVRHSR